MLEILVQIVPYGDCSQKREIAKANISNISRGTLDVCDYKVELRDDRDMNAVFNAAKVYRDDDIWRFLTDILQQRPERDESDRLSDSEYNRINHTTVLYTYPVGVIFERAIEKPELLDTITINEKQYEWLVDKLNSCPEPNERLRKALELKASLEQ